MSGHTKHLDSFLDAEGRLTRFPAKQKMQLEALCYLADKIPENQTFTEKEFNALLNALHTFGDPATLRRELFDFYLIERQKDGSRYWLAPDRPSAVALIEKYCS